MNRSQEILDYLASDSAHRTVVLAPSAPPVAYAWGEVSIILSLVMSAGDVMDTLMVFKTLTAKRELENQASGTFSFGMRNVGRIRVQYLTQRGSKVVAVTRIPFDIPPLDAVCGDPALSAQVMEAATSESGGIIAVSGTDHEANSAFVYGVLDVLNHTKRQIIGIVDNPLTYLMTHRNSIVVQCDVGSDVATLAEGLTPIMGLEPRVVYIGGIRSPDEIATCSCAVRPGGLVIASSRLIDAGTLLSKFTAEASTRAEAIENCVKMAVRITRGPGGKVAVRIA